MKTLLLSLIIPSLCFAGPLDQSAQRVSPYTADQLGALYDKNAISAGTALSGKAVTVTGTIERIDGTGARMKSTGVTEVHCVLAHDGMAAAGKLKAGGRAAFTGTVADYSYGTLKIVNCRVAR